LNQQQVNKTSHKTIMIVIGIMMTGLVYIGAQIRSAGKGEHSPPKSLGTTIQSADFAWEYRWVNEVDTAKGPNWQPGNPGVLPPGRDGKDFLSYRMTLPQIEPTGTWLQIPPIWGHYRVSLDGEVYFAKPGFKDHSIPINERRIKFLKIPSTATAKVLQVDIWSPSFTIGLVEKPVFGDKTELILSVVQKEILRVGISFLLALLGLFYISRGIRKSYQDRTSLGAFYCIMSVYILSRTNLKDLIFQDFGYWMSIEFLTLLAATIPFMCFLYHLFRDRFSFGFLLAMVVPTSIFFAIYSVSMAVTGTPLQLVGVYTFLFVTCGGLVAWRCVPILFRGDINALIFGFSTTLCITLSWIDIAAFLGVIPWAGDLATYGLLVMAFCFELILGSKLVSQVEVPESESIEIPQNKWTLAFPRFFEDQFQERLIKENIKAIRTPHLVNLLGISIGYLIAYVTVPVFFTPLTISLGFLIAASAAVALVLTYHSQYWKFHEPLVGSFTVVVHLVFCWIYIQAPPHLALASVPFLFLGLISNALSQKFRQVTNFLSCLGCCSAWLGAFLYSGIYPSLEGKPFLVIFYLVLVFTLSLFFNRFQESSLRHSFLLDLSLKAGEKRYKDLLDNVMPQSISESIQRPGLAVGLDHADATVIFADLVGFTAWSESHSAHAIAQTMHAIFCKFDDLCDELGVEKIKTIGDSYMAVAGVPHAVENHGERAVTFAYGMLDALVSLNRSLGTNFELRIGIHSGPLASGVIGKRKFAYDVWGDTVNVASRMESTGEPGAIQVSEATYSHIMQAFPMESRHTRRIKGKGELTAYLLKKKMDSPSVRNNHLKASA
jgi:class 3 adenylate cyclase